MTPPTHGDLVRVVAETGVRDERVLDALREVPRADYVPGELVDRAYFDEPLRIPRGQVTTQPSLIARMVEAMGLEGDERVLEVGAGYGFQTALLATLAREVWSVERWPELAEVARANLGRGGIRNAEVVVGDGSEGLAAHAPYDGIVVAAAFPEVPAPLAEQLTEGGLLVHPVGSGGREEVVLFQRTRRGLRRRRTITGAHFVRLYGRYGFED
jgi:protein-L-isoaspartate(D-aspartate) O-methyltransferase